MGQDSFVNKYRDKLIIKSQVKQTKVDRLMGAKQVEAREDEIDFDYKNFKEFCLDGAGNSRGFYDSSQLRKQMA